MTMTPAEFQDALRIARLTQSNRSNAYDLNHQILARAIFDLLEDAVEMANDVIDSTGGYTGGKPQEFLGKYFPGTIE